MFKLLEDVLIAQFTVFVHIEVLDLLVLMVVAVLEIVLDGFSDVFYSPLLVELGLKIRHKQGILFLESMKKYCISFVIIPSTGIERVHTWGMIPPMFQIL